MPSKNKEIANRVKEMRELIDLSAEALADKLHLPVEKYLAYEKGEDDIPASLLYEAARVMNVDLALLLTGDAPKMNIFTVTRKDKGVTVNRRSQYGYQALAANFAGKRIEPFIVTVPTTEKDAKVCLNAHPGQEMDYVLEGTLKVVIHGNEIILNAGDSIFFDSSHPHGMATVGDVPAKFMAIIM